MFRKPVMKISNKGLDYFVSNGLIENTAEPRVYKLYSWEGLTYYAGPKVETEDFDFINDKSIYIELSKEQLQTIKPDKEKNSQQDLETPQKLQGLKKYFNTVVYMSYDESENKAESLEVYGKNPELKNLSLILDYPSPLQIVKKTLKPFHGVYQSQARFDTLLDLCSQDKEKLWITAFPVLSDSKLKGFLIGFSNSTEFGLDVFDVFKEEAHVYSRAA